ncbi:sulfite exporter TauE/SafE family protein [Halopseudomonas sp.]|jgi:uncharacterized membrane protein YfcA|uniref:sulfite exporter TauE/SafE family protein n=1 Tax=Halopseudomonas sp. TaxID=2901191 RepID=UPI0039E55D62
MIVDPWIWVGAFILLAYTVEAITGFGSLIIALSLGALLLPLSQLIPVMIALNVLMSGYMAWRNRRHIHWPTLLKLILPMMLLGTLAGYGMRPWLGDQLLKAAFGILVLWFSTRELWRMYHKHTVHPHPLMLSRILTFGAGITHGLFASGGALLVYAMAGTPLNKSHLRATLLSTWFSLNTCLCFIFLLDGTLVPALPRVVTFIPLLVIGALLGEFLHHRLNEQRFRVFLYSLLVISGTLLLGKALVDM